ncbi:Unknown protein, partial [Striga hermonthica]
MVNKYIKWDLLNKSIHYTHFSLLNLTTHFSLSPQPLFSFSSSRTEHTLHTLSHTQSSGQPTAISSPPSANSHQFRAHLPATGASSCSHLRCTYITVAASHLTASGFLSRDELSCFSLITVMSAFSTYCGELKRVIENRNGSSEFVQSGSSYNGIIFIVDVKDFEGFHDKICDMFRRAKSDRQCNLTNRSGDTPIKPLYLIIARSN